MDLEIFLSAPIEVDSFAPDRQRRTFRLIEAIKNQLKLAVNNCHAINKQQSFLVMKPSTLAARRTARVRAKEKKEQNSFTTSISLTPDVRELLETACIIEGRAASNYVSWLIKQDSKRLAARQLAAA